nr:RNA-dependent RNA polymerase [Flumine noda-like virus 38]
MREMERIVLLRAFRVQYHEQLSELHRSQYKMKAYATFGTWYETEYSRASGSPETALFNSLVNAFVAYLCLRMTTVNGLFIQPEEAYLRLGIYGGDDGLTADVVPSVYRKAASLIGQDLTVEMVKRGDLGIKFLARIYSPDVWFGDNNSCCDIPRQLSKLHVTVSLPSNVTPTMKLLEKIRAYSLSDENTPVIGEYCRAVLRVHGAEILADVKTEKMRSWLARYDKTSQYINNPSEWMVGYLDTTMPEFDYKKFQTWVAGANSFEKLLAPPMFQAQTVAKSTVPVVIDGDVVPYGTALGTKPPRLDKKIRINDHKENFEEMKKRKIAEGTWKDRGSSSLVNVSASSTSTDIKGGSTSSSSASAPKESFERMKERKIKAGTWTEVVDLSGKSPAVKPRPKYSRGRPPLVSGGKGDAWIQAGNWRAPKGGAKS